MTRQVQKLQMGLGQTSIANIEFNLRSRDDIPKILKGLQYIYVTESVRAPIFQLLEEKISPEVDKNRGRPGMALWKILVMGTLKLDLNCDYDRLHELVNHHDLVRQILGDTDTMGKEIYSLQAIKDNIHLLTPELLEAINQLIVTAGHGLLGKKKESEVLRGRCDSFVVETNVHYPTDINLLYDALRKAIQLTSQLSERHGLKGWRQSAYNVKQVKRQVRIIQKKKRVSGKSEAQKEKNAEALKRAHQDLIGLSQGFMNKSEETVKAVEKTNPVSLIDVALLRDIEVFHQHAVRQIGQMISRVLEGHEIPHYEKVFSLFQPHTEWICKGKVGVPVELGLRVCILEDQHQFVLHHRVMLKETDERIAVPMVAETKAKFPMMTSCSFDKGFHSKANQEALKEHLEVVALKRKGKLSQAAKATERSEEFKQGAHKHSAVESAINALEVHGLDKCREHGIAGFKRYVALAVVTRNIHRMGDLLFRREQKKLARHMRRWATDTPLPKAA